MTRDWVRWHQDYESPKSSLARRLRVVRRELRRALTDAPSGVDGSRYLVSMCAGDGRDVLPVLAEQDRGRGVRAVLVELDPVLAQRARTTADELGLAGVEVRTADAGTTDVYLDWPRAQLLLVCGVFGNVPVEDVRRTIASLPCLLAAGGIVIWTRGRAGDAHDPSLDIRTCFTDHGFAELSFTSPADATFRVGMHQLAGRSADRPPLQPGTRLFRFV